MDGAGAIVMELVVMAVAMRGGPGGLEIPRPAPLFEAGALLRNPDYDVADDGLRRRPLHLLC